jgi:hypothetical protein
LNTFDIRVEAGTRWQLSMEYTDSNDVPVPLSTHRAVMQVRRTLGESSALLTLSSQNGRITLSDAGEIFLELDPVTTQGLPAGVFQYDLFLLITGDEDHPVRLVKGRFIVEPSVTRITDFLGG